MPRTNGSGNGRGRPSGFRDEFVIQAKKLCELGATDKEIADFFGVSDRTLYRWMHQRPDFCQSIKSGKKVSDERVERSLYHRAVGYTFDSEKVFQHKGDVVRADVVEHVPPDITACIFWLKNRRPDLWRDKQHIETEMNVEVTSARDRINRELNAISERIEGRITQLASAAGADRNTEPVDRRRGSRARV